MQLVGRLQSCLHNLEVTIRKVCVFYSIESDHFQIVKTVTNKSHQNDLYIVDTDPGRFRHLWKLRPNSSGREYVEIELARGRFISVLMTSCRGPSMGCVKHHNVSLEVYLNTYPPKGVPNVSVWDNRRWEYLFCKTDQWITHLYVVICSKPKRDGVIKYHRGWTKDSTPFLWVNKV